MPSTAFISSPSVFRKKPVSNWSPILISGFSVSKKVSAANTEDAENKNMAVKMIIFNFRICFIVIGYPVQ
ncbi:MAG: hypothetical protein KKD35_01610 [Elusimicrobia bacterium]|nr:hypothetical protein [Elusimicrobiota bacterium]